MLLLPNIRELLSRAKQNLASLTLGMRHKKLMGGTKLLSFRAISHAPLNGSEQGTSP